jgi:hypothetical protein
LRIWRIIRTFIHHHWEYKTLPDENMRQHLLKSLFMYSRVITSLTGHRTSGWKHWSRCPIVSSCEIYLSLFCQTHWASFSLICHLGCFPCFISLISSSLFSPFLLELLFFRSWTFQTGLLISYLSCFSSAFYSIFWETFPKPCLTVLLLNFY